MSRPVLPLAILLAGLLLLAACQSPEHPPVTDPDPIGHVHGIGYNSSDDAVYVAAHFRVFRVEDEKATQIADRFQDTMGFTIVGPDEFLASGHPDATDSRPNPLGLIRSTDRAETWETISLGGESDLHSIDANEDWIFANEMGSGLMRSRDGKKWESLYDGALVDIAADPSGSDSVLATAPNGALVLFRGGQEPEVLPNTPFLTLIDRTSAGTIVGTDVEGRIQISEDDGVTWQAAAGLNGDPEALSVRTDGKWLAATTTAIWTSSDQGATWKPILK